ncbi:hypothetical protein [Aestuariirhabdus litorea]|uniref:Uncharacterized protein n=1 Tax=Aestuariirhabdus litorea TaxID=2528527 RepID=A0A3P3VSH6_9GAMM|nr:hypothetical protein [Aestuariirhabdus litorea]RRJ84449.1 hypothetical protein D0544_04915 [Aestuariirhabdus litorea]RWW97673.1 hypothetical protein DZC74_04905 [Endozoicomonadaceae bacterium GTF-13]
MNARFLLLLVTLCWSGWSLAADSYVIDFVLSYDGKQETYQYRNRFNQPYRAFSGREVSYVKSAESGVSNGTLITNLTSDSLDDGFRVSFTLSNPAFDMRQLANLEYQVARSQLIALDTQPSGIQVPETRVMAAQGIINIKPGEMTLIHEDLNAGFRIEARFTPQ